MADWQDSLKSFLDANPDLPEGEEIQVVETDECPRQPRLDIVLEKKGRAGKMATIVTGFIIDDEEVSAIAAKLKSRLGTGGSARGGEILIQGDRRNDVLKLLSEMGYKARVI
ncbi:MAG: translation initiation factor [Muribaculaceae bacterium]|nr:translation initiation factor [Muribaculaceae bacterium]